MQKVNLTQLLLGLHSHRVEETLSALQPCNAGKKGHARWGGGETSLMEAPVAGTRQALDDVQITFPLGLRDVDLDALAAG